MLLTYLPTLLQFWQSILLSLKVHPCHKSFTTTLTGFGFSFTRECKAHGSVVQSFSGTSSRYIVCLGLLLGKVGNYSEMLKGERRLSLLGVAIDLGCNFVPFSDHFAPIWGEYCNWITAPETVWVSGSFDTVQSIHSIKYQQYFSSQRGLTT